MKKQAQKFYFLLPAIVVPFLFLAFYALGGGKKAAHSAIRPLGLNAELPKANLSLERQALDKLASYQKASQDSATRQKYQQQDPVVLPPPVKDHRADELMQQLDRLQEGLAKPAPQRILTQKQPQAALPEREWDHPDPQLEKIDNILNKVLRIQHPRDTTTATRTDREVNKDIVLLADSSANSIAAVVPTKQVLTTGATICLQLNDDIRIDRALIRTGQQLYGIANVNNDRLLVHITSIRSGRNVYNADLQVYDLDGLPGIHIPGRISRDVAKQSAEQGINGLDLTNYDPTLAGQAATAGIQAAKSFFGHKVRQIRVTVRAGYQLLLRNSHGIPTTNTSELPGETPGLSTPQPPGIVPGGSYLKKSKLEGMEMALQGIYLKDSLLWFSLALRNESPIAYHPAYIRWFIRDRRIFNRTAVQEYPLSPVLPAQCSSVDSDSVVSTWTAFRPFALPKGKELVIEIGEKNNARVVQLNLSNKYWDKIQKQ